MYKEKNGNTEHSKGNTRVLQQVATTRIEFGHKQNNKTSTAIYTKIRSKIGRPRKRWRNQIRLEDYPFNAERLKQRRAVSPLTIKIPSKNMLKKTTNTPLVIQFINY
jgi:hypothetical protein